MSTQVSSLLYIYTVVLNEKIVLLGYGLLHVYFNRND